MASTLPHPGTARGTVLQSTGSWITVQTDARRIRCRVRGRLRLGAVRTTNPVAVGDRVSVRINADGTGLITAVLDRDTSLTRRAAGRNRGTEQVLVSNIGTIWIVQAATLPNPNPGFIDRVLVSAEIQGIKAGLIINKMDLAVRETATRAAELYQTYGALGIESYLTSAVTGRGVEAFAKALAGQSSAIAGPSGVGKSTLLNKVEPGLNLRSGIVSNKTRKGRHTTSYATLLPLSSGGFVIDTPGIREFGLTDLGPSELSHYFCEFRRYIGGCRFGSCTHDHEPGCSIKDAVERRAIAKTRYRSYQNILKSLRNGGDYRPRRRAARRWRHT